jgi:hypothetical protein
MPTDEEPHVTIAAGTAITDGEVVHFTGADYAIGPDMTAVVSIEGVEIATVFVPRRPPPVIRDYSSLLDPPRPLFDVREDFEHMRASILASLVPDRSHAKMQHFRMIYGTNKFEGEYEYRRARVLKRRTRYDLLVLDEDWFR